MGIRVMVLRMPLNECPVCHGNGTVEVAGFSVNPFNGCIGPDPQATDEVSCDHCAGTGVTLDESAAMLEP